MSLRSSRSSTKSTKSQVSRSITSTSTTNAKHIQRDAYFIEKLKQRELDLAMHRKKLEIAKQRHLKNVEIFESERNRVLACYNNSSVEAFAISKKNVTQADMENINKNDDYIHQLYNDIHQQFLYSQKELDDAQNNSQQSNADQQSPEDSTKAEKDIKGRQYVVEQFHQLLNRIKDEVIPHESAITDLETKAKSNEEELQVLSARKSELDRQLRFTQKKYKNALKWIESKKKEKQRIEDQNKHAKLSLIDELRLQEELNRKEEELKQSEAALQEKVNANDAIVKHIQDLRKSTIDMDTQRRSNEANLQNTDRKDAPTVTELESLKFEIQKANARADEMEKCIEDMKKDPLSLSKIAELKDKLEKAKAENTQLLETANSISQDDSDELKNKIASKIKEIQQLQSQIISEEDLEARNFKLRNEAKSLFSLERSIMQRTASLNYLEEEIENDESALIQAEDELKREKNLILTKIAHTDKMLDLYTLQKQDADERLITIQNQLNKLKFQ
ncbi:hypothetical protein TVAG_207600 [Trichomonas vaginalis G3]|uniref:Uncharacterized protein n=1 Tax=Trichomonas vaginalis (strain ATCC PRA-98 / G3) TaxID=412133 RepID=A2F2M3_TRIV3|nr:hypothetical protein TVAGG3_0105370 [Trichomonas vaginalis G3]EAY00857.1 hypothetical protein TVAG_207600 [Trichomonas vaginalis G3]KAI5544615.1 hypothetical protein TVAGG3_0105370 [Trichomonas vaginalis G3]|eukprot:XP_001313786.1 hypothetical protein [Trichomonas vaginalis G3]